MRDIRGFGLIELLAVLILIGLLYTLGAKTNFWKATGRDKGYIEQQLAIKTKVENDIHDIQKLAKKRYAG